MVGRGWMSGASIEETLELWAASLREVKARMRPLFTQDRVAASAGLFLDGLLGEERRKTGWMRAEAAGGAGPWRQQVSLGRGSGLPWPLPETGDPGAATLGCRGFARHCAKVRGKDACRTERRPGGGR